MRDRSAFGYVEPVSDGPAFAQCKTCRLWIEDLDRCYWLMPNDEVLQGDTCILYVEGPPNEFEQPCGAVTKKEVGLVRGDVRCENCDAFDKGASACKLFRRLNQLLPHIFNLEAAVKAKACCNAFNSEKVKNLY